MATAPPNGALPGSLVNPETLNRYAYAGDDPVDNVDPSALERLVWCHYWELGW
jgi:hypothetical protein